MLLVSLIWGVNFSVMKGALPHFPPLAFTAVRFAGSSVVLWLIQRRVEGVQPLPPGTLLRLIVLGVVGNTLYQLAFILGLERTTASNSALLLSAVPTAVALLGAVVGAERLTRRVAVGTAVATAGVVLVVAARGAGFSSATITGDLLTLAAMLCWAGYTLGVRSVGTAISPLRLTTLTTLTGTPGLVLAGIPDLARMQWRGVTPAAWAALGYSSMLSLVVAYLLWNRSVRAVGPNRTAIYMCVTPLVAVASAWVLLGEVPVPLQGVGALFIVAGVLLTRR